MTCDDAHLASYVLVNLDFLRPIKTAEAFEAVDWLADLPQGTWPQAAGRRYVRLSASPGDSFRRMNDCVGRRFWRETGDIANTVWRSSIDVPNREEINTGLTGSTSSTSMLSDCAEEVPVPWRETENGRKCRGERTLWSQQNGVIGSLPPSINSVIAGMLLSPKPDISSETSLITHSSTSV